MHPHFKLLLVFLVFVTVFAACNKVGNPEYNDRPVVAGYLIAGRNPVVGVSRQLSTSSGVGVSGEHPDSLRIYLSDDSATYTLTYADTAYTNTAVTIQAGKTYKLSFMYNGKEVTASTTIPSHPQNYKQSVTSISVDKIDPATIAQGFMGGGFSMPDPVDLTWTNDDNSYYMVVVENTATNPELIRDTLTGNTRPPSGFRNQPSISATASLRAMSFEYFGMHRLILFHLQPEYATLYETSSSSSQDLTTPVTNITNGFGIFTGINADTLQLNVIKK